jgi:RecA/RadA recombinase
MSSDPFNDIAKVLEKELGIVSEDGSTPKNYLDTGIPQLNAILTGDPMRGIPSGRITEISGESSSGKTMLATRLMISAQKQGGMAIFFDHERSYRRELSVRQGMSIEAGKFIYRDGRMLEKSLVEAVGIAKLVRERKMIPDSAPIVVIFDSFAAMVPMSKLYSKGPTGKLTEKGVDEYTMNDTTALARAASACLPAFKIQVNDYNMCAVFLNQLAETMDMHGPKTKTKGGKSLPFFADVRLTLGGKDIKEAVSGRLIKKELTVTTKKNKLFMPWQKCDVDFVFERDGSGDFEIIATYAKYLKNLKAIDGSGAWLTFDGERINGMTKLVEMLNADPVKGLSRLRKVHAEYIESLGGDVSSVIETVEPDADEEDLDNGE